MNLFESSFCQPLSPYIWLIFSFESRIFFFVQSRAPQRIHAAIPVPGSASPRAYCLFVYLFGDLVRLFHSSLSPLKCAACDVTRERLQPLGHAEPPCSDSGCLFSYLSASSSVGITLSYELPLTLVHCSIVFDKAPGHKLLHSQFQLNSCLFAGLLFGGLPRSFVPT